MSILRVRRGMGQLGTQATEEPSSATEVVFEEQVVSFVSLVSSFLDTPYTWSQLIWCGFGSSPCIGHCLSSSTIIFTFFGSKSSLRNIPK